MESIKPKTIDIRTAGWIFGLLDIVLYGCIPVVANTLVRRVDPTIFAAVVTFLGSLPFVLHTAIKGRLHEMFARKLMPHFILISVSSAVAVLLFCQGTLRTSAMNTGILEQSEPIFSLLLAAFILKEKISKEQLLATLVMLTGAVIVVYRGFSQINTGDLMIFTAPLFFQIAHLSAKKVLPLVSYPTVVAGIRLFFGGVILLIFAALTERENFGQIFIGKNLIALIGFALVFRTLDMYLWYEALKRLPLAKLSALLPVGAGVAFLTSMIFLGEVASWRHWLGLILIVTGLIWLARVDLKSIREA